MKTRNTGNYIYISLLVVFIIPLFSQEKPETSTEKPDTTKQKITLESLTKSSKIFKGMFEFYQDTLNGSLQMLIKKDQLNKEFIHFGLTSQDINNTAIPLSVKEFISNVYIPELDKLIKHLDKIAIKFKNITIISRTHGQPASPTKLGKEIFVFITFIFLSPAELKKIVKTNNNLK